MYLTYNKTYRCTGLERFACIGWDLPDSEPDEWQVWDDLDVSDSFESLAMLRREAD